MGLPEVDPPQPSFRSFFKFGGRSASATHFSVAESDADHTLAGRCEEFGCRRWLLRGLGMQNTCLIGQNGQDTCEIREAKTRLPLVLVREKLIRRYGILVLVREKLIRRYGILVLVRTFRLS